MNDTVRLMQPGPGGLSRRDILVKRHTIRRAVRFYLDTAGYTEIDAPLLVRGTTPDPAVESFRVGDRYLATSTEYQMKRLALGGFERLYSLTQNFRAGDIVGPFRNPEFTMLEFGRTGCGISAIESDVEGLTLAAMQALGLGDTASWQGRQIDMRAPWERITVADAVARYTGTDFADFSLESCLNAAQAAGLAVKEGWDRDFLFSLLMTHIQPQLGLTRPVFLRGWPLHETSSAAASADGLTTDRSQLFIAGIEIGDGFAALADADIQMYLFGQALEKRAALGMEPVEIDQLYIDAMLHNPPFGAGMALGFDRLVMLLTDQPHIRQVLAFHWDEL